MISSVEDEHRNGQEETKAITKCGFAQGYDLKSRRDETGSQVDHRNIP